MRKRIYEIIEASDENDKISKAYDILMMIAIFVSIVPLTRQDPTVVYGWLDKVTVTIFIIDYFLRLITADFKLGKKTKSFIRYPFTPMAIVDLVSILPSLTFFNSGLKLFRILRLFRTLRIFKVFRYSKNVDHLINVFKRQKESLSIVAMLAVGYIFISALIIFNVEPDTFGSFFDAVYWAVVSLTTVGYGDLYAVTVAGKVVTMVSAIFGIAIVALPAGIITAGYMDELKNNNEEKKEEQDD